MYQFEKAKIGKHKHTMLKRYAKSLANLTECGHYTYAEALKARSDMSKCFSKRKVKKLSGDGARLRG